MKKITLLLLLLSLASFSQTIRVKPPCFTDELRRQIVTNNPQIQNIINQMDLELNNNANNSSLNSVAHSKITIS